MNEEDPVLYRSHGTPVNIFETANQVPWCHAADNPAMDAKPKQPLDHVAHFDAGNFCAGLRQSADDDAKKMHSARNIH